MLIIDGGRRLLLMNGSLALVEWPQLRGTIVRSDRGLTFDGAPLRQEFVEPVPLWEVVDRADDPSVRVVWDPYGTAATPARSSGPSSEAPTLGARRSRALPVAQRTQPHRRETVASLAGHPAVLPE